MSGGPGFVVAGVVPLRGTGGLWRAGAGGGMSRGLGFAPIVGAGRFLYEGLAAYGVLERRA